MEIVHIMPIGHREDIRGRKFNDLTVICLTPDRIYGGRGWVCLCKCGRETVVSTGELSSGGKKSCGCRKRRTRADWPLWTGHGEISGAFWAKVKRAALSRGLTVSVTIQEVWELFLKQNRRCALSGVEIAFSSKSEKDSAATASLDRINSDYGYEPGNIQWTHKDVNVMKQDMPEDVFLSWVKLINKHKT